MSSPPVPVVSPPEPPQPLTLVCANCHALAQGEYCAACGQRHEPHIHTVTHFAGEAFESISHADSRLWRTLWYLLARPGFLTREFFAGRRVSYLPPFRLYLVISVLFFLVAGVPKDAEIVDPSEAATGEATGEKKPKARPMRRTGSGGSDSGKSRRPNGDRRRGRRAATARTRAAFRMACATSATSSRNRHLR